MKKSILTLAFAASLISVKAQIKLWPGGVNSYGTLSAPPSGVKHLIGGSVTFDAWTDVKLDWNSGYCCGTPVLYPENDWYFQLGTSSKYLGDAFINHISTRVSITFTSDRTLKQNINYDINTLDRLLKLKPASYNFKPTLVKSAPEQVQNKIASTKEYGLIAQEVAPIFPELVEKDSITGLMGIKYVEFIPMLIDAIKIQNDKIENLTKLVNANSSNGTLDQSSTNRTQNPSGDNITKSSSLAQNKPNPFNTETTIEYRVTNSVSECKIIIFDMNGKLIKTYKIRANENSLVIKANELNQGMYLYSLVVDNTEIDTKKMIITE
jgi:hypothetical protein